uniref:DNRLRE domain-containing protein n=1 Tax=candidate division WOR-3 bacterium TaxID=2052148 RepID=A0A7C4XUF9_UNCW3
MKNLVILIFAILFLFHCNKSPIGEDELTLRGGFETDTLFLPLFTSSTAIKNIPLGSSQNLVLCKDNNYESRILLRFSFSDTTYQGLDEIKLVLYRNTTFKSDSIIFSVHLLNHEFTESEATWYKKSNTEPWENPGGDFEFDSLRMGKAKGDSLIVWFNYIDLNKIRNAKGLILVPRSTGFLVFTSREGGKAPSFKIIKNNVIHTVPLSSDCHIAKTDSLPNPWEDWLGSGISYRNFVIFNYDTILNNSRPIFGELTFSLAGYSCHRDSVEIGVRYLVEPFTGFETKLGPVIALKKFSLKDTIFKIDVVEYVQRIVENSDSNFGLFIYLSPENFDIANIKLIKGSHKLKVGYVRPPEER